LSTPSTTSFHLNQSNLNEGSSLVNNKNNQSNGYDNQMDNLSQNNVTLSSVSMRLTDEMYHRKQFQNLNDLTTSAHEFLNTTNVGTGVNKQYKINNKKGEVYSPSTAEARRHDAAAPDANLSKLTASNQNLGTHVVPGGHKVLPTATEPFILSNQDECMFYSWVYFAYFAKRAKLNHLQLKSIHSSLHLPLLEFIHCF
jgi:hypothetical protein